MKLTELAAEPLGLTFIGRGFDVKINTPSMKRFKLILQKVAAECGAVPDRSAGVSQRCRSLSRVFYRNGAARSKLQMSCRPVTSRMA